MNLVIKQEVAQRIGYDKLVPFGITTESWKSSWRNEATIDLGRWTMTRVEELEELIMRYKNVRGAGVLLADIKAWKTVLTSGAAEMKARTVRQFETLLKQFLLKAPGHRVYKRHDRGAMLAHFVCRVEYYPSILAGDRSHPAYVEMKLAFHAIGGIQGDTISFYEQDCRNIPVAAALAEKGFFIETDELRAEYLASLARYAEVAPAIGKQFWAAGPATTISNSYWDKTNFELDRYGEPSRVVVDVFFEDGKQPRESHVNVDRYFWPNVAKVQSYDPLKDEDTTPISEQVDLGIPDDPEVPTHPWVVVFHLEKHIRLQAHVGQLTEYVYDEQLSEKLILPRDQKELVKLLIDTKGGNFVDIVRGKGGGAVVLLSGPPGTGKTLTAEVYAESEQRALYSVQCSQLGTNPEKLEAALIHVFDRARRWNAVMLLDEADVYVRQRGSDMAQNAVVGVFLRVLEYQATVLFLTTNRPDDVDDAIASRCIARLSFKPPNAGDAARIWRTLADNSKVKITERTIDEFIGRHPGQSGRDIKNLLKLGALLRRPTAEGLSVADLEYVQQFKPT